jgi:hypothetical protein
MDELKNIGATVIPYNGEMPEELRNQKFVEVVDMSQVQ